jgi:hypothetical protein
MVSALLLTALLLPPATPDTLTFSGRALELEVTPPRMEDPGIAVDGRLDEEAWKGAAVLDGFTQYEPVEGVAASQPTEVRVFYTPEAIYFGVQAADGNPEEILARMGERDRSVFGDDWIRIMLDTFDDQRQAYVFYVNPLGIQTDGLWIEGLRKREGRPSSVSIDFNPDFIWESDGTVTTSGWQAEIRIPYLSLRFPSLPEQSWGVNVAREVKRKGFKQSWAPLTKNVSSTLAQSGRLVGLRGLEPRRLVEINPVSTGKRVGRTVDGRFSRDDPEIQAGVNARYGITRNLVLDVTANPDFSQVEADASRITVNQRFALYFPEKRPFFLEGSEVFETPQQLVYTRRIADPVGGAKLSGKVGKTSLGYLGALDESPSTLLGEGGEALFNLLRLRRDVGSGSTAGLLYTDRTMTRGGDFNRVAAADVRLLFRGRYTLATQWAGSWTSVDGSSADLRPSVFASFSRSGRTFAFDVRFHDMHPDFRAHSGYLPRIGEAIGTANATLARYGRPGAFLERASLTFRLESYFDHDELWNGGGPYEAEVQVNPGFFFRGDRSVTFIVRNGYFEFPRESYTAYQVEGPGGEPAPFRVPAALENLKAVAMMPRLRITNASNLNGRFYFRELPLYAEAARGLELLLGPRLSLKPTRSLSLDLAQTYSRLWRRRDGTDFSTAVVSRITSRYQFNRAFSARALVQYSLEKRDALLDPVTDRPLLVNGAPAEEAEEGLVQGQFLVQYQPSPGTIFYVGYTRLMEGAATYDLNRMHVAEDGLFVKLSYLFRL